MYRKITQEKLLKCYKCFQAPMDIIKNYVDFKSLGATFYADGCYIKTPKGIIERLSNVPTQDI